MIIADGVRPDVLARSIARGDLPALAGLRDEGSLSTVTSAFPSVTGPAYAPFIMGRYPGSVGLPGLRWYDRSRRIPRLSGHSRSYVGPEMRFVDRLIREGRRSSVGVRDRHRAEALSSDDVACSLITSWYVQHREEGGEQDAAMEAVLARLQGA